jgi:hypothetical protein
MEENKSLPEEFQSNDYSNFAEMFGQPTFWNTGKDNEGQIADLTLFNFQSNPFLSESESLKPSNGSESVDFCFDDTGQSDNIQLSTSLKDTTQSMLRKCQIEQNVIDHGGQLKVRHGTLPKNKNHTSDDTKEIVKKQFTKDIAEMLHNPENRKLSSSRIKAFIGRCLGIIQFLKDKYNIRYLLGKNEDKDFLWPLCNIYSRLCILFNSEHLM